jgi:hypothetical protein
MYFTRPVDTDEPSRLLRHRSPFCCPPGHRNARHSLYWRSRRNSPPGLHRGQPSGALVPPRHSKHRGQWVAPGRSARSGQSIMPTGSWTL